MMDQCVAASGQVLEQAIRRREVMQLFRDPNYLPDAAGITTIRTVMQGYGPAIAELRKLRHCRAGRFEIIAAENPLETYLPQYYDTGRAISVLQTAMVDSMLSGDDVAAVDDLLAMLNVGRIIGDEPSIIALRARMDHDSAAVESLEYLLGCGRTSAGQLEQISQAVDRSAADPVAKWGFRGERAVTFAAMDYFSRHPFAVARDINPGAGWNGWLCFAPANVVKLQAVALRNQTEAIAVLDKPTWNWIEDMKEIETKCNPAQGSLWVNFLSLSQPATQEVSRQARLRLATLALAIERYRLAHGRWPAGPEELVADGKLPAWPVDPFDGKPLRWKPVDFGILLYSIGPGGVDEFGKYDPSLRGGTSSNITFRLYNPDQRRRPAPSP
jgi:hypothetical protein